MSNQDNNSSVQGGQVHESEHVHEDGQVSQNGQTQPIQDGVQNDIFSSNQTPPISAENPNQNQSNTPEFSQNNENQPLITETQPQPTRETTINSDPADGQANINFDNYTPDLIGDSGNNNNQNNSAKNQENGSKVGLIITVILIVFVAVGLWYSNKDAGLNENNNNNGKVVVDDTPEQGSVTIVNDKSNDQVLADNGNTVKITAYYNKISSNECENVALLEREVEKKYNSEVINTVRGLLTPLTDSEISQGWLTSLPVGTNLKYVKIKNGLAEVSLSSALRNVAGSCRVLAIRSQIEKTLLQFPYIKSVKICIENDCNQDEILQP
ncbi:MAG: hypothetical protein A3B89_02420 [Candidatus Buchananbacteria bacterium RIFCSPHIGHO2_02_FULL_40_13]|uniref:GerMN domain-containing protein n=1 Tax=Candidatus Buchananbacteria bacterium RIFCSPLOWO2_01_FULL_39_33 TaxID=1797543 RepID=A0A1G1YMG9_9BACT|nr:MAG: hypothetical protein A3B89_02420 [Candidatus Buchananbacteria bacterium RIFCSPHIGHO2_02_FULL_40_13]OGY53006.1 MAG: hypothetical protein A3A02_04845 [Candidatus Buchananbacteria bacterium RIFCSPLOWO2_01_FULL_39_33]